MQKRVMDLPKKMKNCVHCSKKFFGQTLKLYCSQACAKRAKYAKQKKNTATSNPERPIRLSGVRFYLIKVLAQDRKEIMEDVISALDNGDYAKVPSLVMLDDALRDHMVKMIDRSVEALDEEKK